jgi:hypothetical protein
MRRRVHICKFQAPPKQAAGQEDFAERLRENFSRSCSALAQLPQKHSGPNGCIAPLSKFQFNGGGGWRTYIGFTHSAFS